MLLQIDPGNVATFKAKEAIVDAKIEMKNEEHVYLIEDLSRLERRPEWGERTRNPKNVTKLSGYLFLTEQMGWKKGLKVLVEQGEEAIKSNYNKSTIWKDLNQNTGIGSPRKKDTEP